jgi:hypothetical protein
MTARTPGTPGEKNQSPEKSSLGVLGVLAVSLSALAAACGVSRGNRGGALEPRFVAVHNTLSAMGLAQIGPIQEGSLLEGREARLSLVLPAGCATIVVVGGDGVRDLDAILLDAHEKPLAHDTTNEPQAVLRTCLEASDTYVLVVKAASGAGPWVAATWVGGPGSPGTPAAVASKQDANGTCSAPIALSPGIVSGSTTRGDHENSGSCGPSDSRELVYELPVTQRQRVIIEVEASFDSVLYLRKDDCGDADKEVECNDDAPDRTHSRIDRVLDPGTYFVFIDGYGHETGSFKMTVSVSDVLALADICRRAPFLADGTPQGGTTSATGEDEHGTCGASLEGADTAWRVDLPTRSRVRIVEHSDEIAPVVHFRRVCAEALSEVACGATGAAAGDSAVTGMFEAGTYTAFADARDRRPGRYTLLLQTAPPAGSGGSSEGCGDAVPLGGAPSGTVEGDTFAARDDVSGSCGGGGAADLVYRLDVQRRSRLVASLDNEEAPHVLIAWRRCADRSGELACGRSINEVLAPGTYFIGVDGATPGAFGRFSLKWTLRDLTAQAGACALAPTLVERNAVASTTIGASDRFSTRCGPSAAGTSGPDRVFKIVVARRGTIRILAMATTFDPVVVLRKSCADVAGALPAELACDADADSNHRTTLDRLMEAGTYWVVVDGQSPNDQGPFTVEYRTLP